MLVGKGFRLPALMSAVYELGLNFQKWMNESSLLFSSYSCVKKQDGRVVNISTYVLCAVCIVKLNYLICFLRCLAFELTLSQCLWKLWVFFISAGNFIYYWVSGVRSLNPGSCVYVGPTSTTIIKISSEFGFNIL